MLYPMSPRETQRRDASSLGSATRRRKQIERKGAYEASKVSWDVALVWIKMVPGGGIYRRALRRAIDVSLLILAEESEDFLAHRNSKCGRLESWWNFCTQVLEE